MPLIFIPSQGFTDFHLPTQGVSGFYYYDRYGNDESFLETFTISQLGEYIVTVDSASDVHQLPIIENSDASNATATFVQSWTAGDYVSPEPYVITFFNGVDSTLARATPVPIYVLSLGDAFGMHELLWYNNVDSNAAVQTISPIWSDPKEATNVQTLLSKTEYNDTSDGITLFPPLRLEVPTISNTSESIDSITAITKVQYTDILFDFVYVNPVVDFGNIVHTTVTADQSTHKFAISEDDVPSITVTYDNPVLDTVTITANIIIKLESNAFQFSSERELLAAVSDETVELASPGYIKMPPSIPAEPVSIIEETTFNSGVTLVNANVII